ncbi:DUF2059 domain-containing protein [Acinetobacter brisouii]|uniref:DUF2059 domain-containing protein n=1 Tax=Acinetobacter brisouii TaxID=396323 RepID=UPI00124D08E2|nr:DUF2059 domain-containing protein [Acinetobacter brisouii]
MLLKTTIKSALTIGLMSCAVTAFASPAQPKSVDELLKLANIDQTIQNSINNMQPYYYQQGVTIVKDYTQHTTLNQQELNAASQLSQLMLGTTRNILTQSNFHDVMQKIYAQQFSEQEVQAYIRFLKTPEGQAINRKTPALIAETSKQMAQISTSVMQQPQMKQQLQVQVANILKPITPAPQPTPAPTKPKKK